MPVEAVFYVLLLYSIKLLGAYIDITGTGLISSSASAVVHNILAIRDPWKANNILTGNLEQKKKTS